MRFLRPLAMILGIVAVALLAIVLVRRAMHAPNKASIATITLETEAFLRTIPAEGYLKAEQATPISAPPGRQALKIAWLKENGSSVKQGEVVVRFDRSQFERNLEDGESDKEVARAKLASERVQSGDARASRIRTADLARMDLEVTKARAEEGREAIFSKNEILTSRIDDQLSEARVEHAGETNRIDQSISRKKIELLALQKKAADIKISQANSGLERMEVTAPHDGIFVLEKADLKAGDMVYPGRPIAKLPLLDTMEAEVFVLEADAMGLAVGIGASLHLEAHPEAAFAASIKKVDALAKRRQKEVPIQYFAVTLAIEKTNTKLMKPGGRVKASLTIDSLDAIVVSRQHIFNVDGTMVAYRRGVSGFEAVKVKLGPGTPGRIVVEEGLASGDVIATRDPFKVASKEKGADEGEASSDPEASP